MNRIIDKIKNIDNKKIYRNFFQITILLILSSIISCVKIDILQKIPFYFFGVWVIYFLIMCFYGTIKKVNFKSSKFFWSVACITMIVCFIMYLVNIINTKQIYTWDQRCYYNNQLDLNERFNQSFHSGIKRIIGSTYKEDYGYFLLSFTTLPFSFSNMTEYAFIITYAFWLILPVILIWLTNIENIIQKLNFKNEKIALIISAILLIVFPLLHKAAITGQPDIFGLFWIGLIVLLTFDYDFSKKDYTRWGMIILFSFLLAITRRWYIFFMIGYYLIYGIIMVLDALIKKDKIVVKKVIRNELTFLIVASISLVILLFPIIIKTVKANYTVSYSDWKFGGVKNELNRQEHFIGCIGLLFMLIGGIYGIANKNTRNFSVRLIGSYFLILFLFNRVQSMGYHQSLILMPEYILLFELGIIAICQIKNTIIMHISSFIVVIYLMTSTYGTFSENKKFFSNAYYSNISLKPIYRDDYENIGKVVDFIKENCTEENDKVYANFASVKYCGDTFRFFLMPDKYLMNIVYYESAIDNVHGFPIGILDSKYVLIANKVIDSTGATKSTIIPTINEAFKNDEIIRNRFEKVKDFKITNEFTFYCYERKVTFDQTEAVYWKEKFNKQSIKNPKIFEERIDNYLEKMENNKDGQV